MANFVPQEIDNYFFLDSLLIFLMINYALPLGTIYMAMVILGALMYYVAADQRLFHWIPFAKKGNYVMGSIIGIAMGVGFIYLYKQVGSSTPMANVFATTAFGESETIGKLVYSFLIPIAETRFFFRTILQWSAWKTNISTKNPFTFDGIKLIAIFSGIFTMFHATALGITNNQDLMLTFGFAAISIAAILHFQELIQATVLHIVVNGYAVGFIAALSVFAQTVNKIYLIIGIAGGLYLLSKRKGGLPFITT